MKNLKTLEVERLFHTRLWTLVAASSLLNCCTAAINIIKDMLTVHPKNTCFFRTPKKHTVDKLADDHEVICDFTSASEAVIRISELIFGFEKKMDKFASSQEANKKIQCQKSVCPLVTNYITFLQVPTCILHVASMLLH